VASPSYYLFSPILGMTNFQGHRSLNIRRALVQTPLPFRSMTAVHCDRGYTSVAPPIQYTLVSKCPGNVRCQLVRSDLGPHHLMRPRKATVIRNLATLWEQQCMTRFSVARKAFNPHIKSPRWPCKSSPLTPIPFLFVILKEDLAQSE